MQQNIKERVMLLAQEIDRLASAASINLHTNTLLEANDSLLPDWETLPINPNTILAFNAVKQSILSGQLDENKFFLDTSSECMNIEYATIGKVIGFSVAIILPKNISAQRKKTLKILDAHILYSSEEGGVAEAHHKALILSRAFPDIYYYHKSAIASTSHCTEKMYCL